MEVNPLNVYDPLAGDYDEKIEGDRTNALVREYVRVKCKALLTKNARVLDFGGGTGLDLYWLSPLALQIYFCEPSSKMREKAVQRVKNEDLNNVRFMDGIDFRVWNEESFSGNRIDLVLANFGVLNSILEIQSLFRALWEYTSPDAKVVICVLNVFPKNYKMIKPLQKAIDRLRLIFTNKSYITEGKDHKAIIHSLPKLISSSAPYFKCIEKDRVPRTMFKLYTFVRRNDISLDQ
jgi:SAM-dependent methyltransferase